jgi:hypothetical protein
MSDTKAPATPALKNASAYINGASTVFETIELAGIEFNQRVPADYATFDLAAGRELAALGFAVSNHGYRGFATYARTAMADALAAKYSDVSWDKKTQSAAKYIDSVRTSKGESEVNVFLLGTIHEDTFLFTLENSRERNGTSFSKELVKQLEGIRARWESSASSPENTAATLAKLGVIWTNPSKDVEDSVILPLLRDYKREHDRQAAAAL